MTLKEYSRCLQDFLKENPDTENLTVIYSEDDEGNNFNLAYFSGARGYYNDDREFIHKSEFEELNEDYGEEIYKECNAVCIN